MAWFPDNRVSWFARNILPQEAALRAWLHNKRLADLDADDIVQETYARLAALDDISGIREPKSYMFQIAHSIIALHFRRSRIVSITATADLDQFGIMSPYASPEQEVAFRDELRQLAIALASLPEKWRRAFLLRRVSGLSQRQTAERLKISEKTVEKYMAKSVQFLMDTFGRGGKVASRASMERWDQNSQNLAEPHDKTDKSGG